MNPQLIFYLAQARTADLLREAQRQFVASSTRDRRRAARTAIRRIAKRVSRAGTTSVPPTTLGSSSERVRVLPRSARPLARAGCEVAHPTKPPCGDGLDPRCAASTARMDSPARASATVKSGG